jgi:hypothetical protein
MWNILSCLRDECGSGAAALNFPDPPPAAASTHVRMTRTTRDVGGVIVASTAQLVVVLLALCERALQCEAVRDELEAGFKESRDLGKESREGLRKEGDRWDGVKQATGGKAGEDAKEDKKKKNPEVRMVLFLFLTVRLNSLVG